MDFEKLAQKAEQARAALIELAAEGAKVPKLRLNLLRSIELLDELAIRARGGGAALENFEGGAQISSAMPGGLNVGPGSLPELRTAVTPVELVEREIAVRRDLARKNGAKGGARRTAAQVAAFEKARQVRAAKVAEQKAVVTAVLPDSGK